MDPTQNNTSLGGAPAPADPAPTPDIAPVTPVSPQPIASDAPTPSVSGIIDPAPATPPASEASAPEATAPEAPLTPEIPKPEISTPTTPSSVSSAPANEPSDIPATEAPSATPVQTTGPSPLDNVSLDDTPVSTQTSPFPEVPPKQSNGKTRIIILAVVAVLVLCALGLITWLFIWPTLFPAPAENTPVVVAPPTEAEKFNQLLNQIETDYQDVEVLKLATESFVDTDFDFTVEADAALIGIPTATGSTNTIIGVHLGVDNQAATRAFMIDDLSIAGVTPINDPSIDNQLSAFTSKYAEMTTLIDVPTDTQSKGWVFFSVPTAQIEVDGVALKYQRPADTATAEFTATIVILSPSTGSIDSSSTSTSGSSSSNSSTNTN